MTNDEAHSAIVRWVAAKTGVTTIKAHQGGAAPALPYIMVNMTGFAEVRENAIDIEFTETDELNSEDEKIVEAAPVTEMEWRFSVHAYGDNPTDQLRPIVSVMKLSQGTEPAYPGLTIHEASQIRNVPDWINNEWQPRAQMDLFARGIIRDASNVDVIDEYSFDIAQS
ncbi:phage neck terminator protein [Hoeflea alexandrii]|uniref:Phage neck terminator protein gp12-like domain-containing protein n=1 Tax=Hoeflea alexandrii TaxID=288436 RepID=A0ABT1CPP5_9HYPH|nr:hypothetical protein [Hoeflea alexandrii]MCO6407361.1 hypothetical protein [Hoeflea alexandrii]MCY0154242.1 hypothetical protein [Hoeflea alexandrii]